MSEELILKLQRLRATAEAGGQDDIVKQIDAELARLTKKRKG